MNKIKKIIIFITFNIFLFPLFSQEVIHSIEENYFYFESLSDYLERPYINYRTLSDSKWEINKLKESDNNIWTNINFGNTYNITKNINLKFFGTEWFNSYNSSLPFGQNDGALWQGKGYNTYLTSGIRFSSLGFDFTLKPIITFSQNLAFEYFKKNNGNKFNYFYTNNIDLVQRFGDKSYFQFDFGDSEIRYSWKNLTIGFGTQTPWIGVSQINPMLGSNNSASYPKFDLGLRKTKIFLPWNKWYFGDIEARMWGGKLTESNYFDDNPDNNYRLLSGLSLGYKPSFIPGLSLGINRIFITNFTPSNFIYFLHLISPVNLNTLGADGEDQKVSLNFDWLFPKVGFEVYGEYGFDDFSADNLSNPFHTGIYTLGINQYLKTNINNLQIRLFAELNNFEMSQDFQLQWNYIGYYGHGGITQGYTQKGQILGAGTGYFGNSQLLGIDFYYPKGLSSFTIQRFCPDINYIYNKAVIDSTKNTEITSFYSVYETYLNFTLSSTYYISHSFSITTKCTYSYIHDYMYIENNNLNNFNINIILKYNL